MTLSRRLAAEFVGTAMLLAVVVGSGIMGETLAGGNAAIAFARQHHSDGRHPGGADPNPGAGLGRAFQPGGDRRLPDEAGDRARRRGALHPRAGGRGAAGRGARAHHVRTAGAVHGVRQGAVRLRAGVLGGDCGLRAGADDPALPEGARGGRGLGGRALHHRRLLVHRVHLLRQSGGGRSRAPSPTPSPASARRMRPPSSWPSSSAPRSP